MPTATTATEDPKPDHGLLDWNFLTLMDDGFACGPHIATYTLAERLLCELGGLEQAMGAALDGRGSDLRWSALAEMCEALEQAVKTAGRVCHLALRIAGANHLDVADADEKADEVRRRVQADLARMTLRARHE